MSASGYFTVEQETSVVIVIAITMCIISLVSGTRVLILRASEQRPAVGTWPNMPPKPAARYDRAARLSAAMEMSGAGYSHGGINTICRLNMKLIQQPRRQARPVTSSGCSLQDMMKASVEVLAQHKAAMHAQPHQRLREAHA